jgi:tetratricopeptide (TPR) repeat protein
MRKYVDLIIILALFTVILACYSSVLNAGFVWDDEFIVLRNSLLRAPIWSLQAFRQDIVNSSFTYTLYYRPLQILSYAVDYRAGGMNPFVFHLANIFLHFLNSVVVLFLAYKVSGEKSVAFLTSIIFAIHPAQMAAVAYISGRTDLLFFLFGALFLMFFIWFREKKEHAFLAAGIVFLCAALLSKEAALVFPFLCLFMDLSVLRKGQRIRLADHLPAFAVIGLYAVLHRHITGGSYGFLSLWGAGMIERGAQWLKTMGEFLVMGVFPHGLRMRHLVSAAGENLLAGLIFLGLAIAAVIFLKERRRVLLFGAGFFVIALLPFLFVTGPFQVFAEHWMYLAGFGLFLFVSTVLIQVYTKGGRAVKGAVLAVIYAGIVFYSGSTISQNRYWVDDAALSDRMLDFSQEDAVAAHYKAVSMLKCGKGAGAMDIAEDISLYHPDNAQAWYLKGRLNLASGNIAEAERSFRRSLELQPGYDCAYLGLAMAVLADDRGEEGLGYLESAARANPKHPETLIFQYMAYSKTGERAKALRIAEEARRYYPYNFETFMNLGEAHIRSGRVREGAFLYLEAADLYPENPQPLYNLGYVFYMDGQKEEAKAWLRKAVMTDPGFMPAIELLRKIRDESEPVSQ